jgi:hypothetical protein
MHQPRLNNPAWKRPVQWYSGERIYPESTVGYGYRIPGMFQPKTASFLRVFAENSRNNASGFIVLGSENSVIDYSYLTHIIDYKIK